MLIAMATVCGHVQEQPEQQRPLTFSERWAGHPRDDVVFEFGSPTETLALSNGNKLLSYHSESGVSAAKQRGFSDRFVGVTRADSLTTTVWCDRRFEIDGTMTVVRAMIAGDGCQ